MEYPHPKSMAKTLRAALNEQGIDVSHSKALELVAQQFGVTDWNVLSAHLEGLRPADTLVIPRGWRRCGRFSPHQYRVGVARDARGIARAEAMDDEGTPNDSFAGLMQSMSAESYLGKKIRLSAELKARKAGSGTIWMRVDAENGAPPLAFDNMMYRDKHGVVTGTMDWTARSIVLSVPEEAQSIHFGFFLMAPGAVLARGFRLETVSGDVADTGGNNLPSGPNNLVLE